MKKRLNLMHSKKFAEELKSLEAEKGISKRFLKQAKETAKDFCAKLDNTKFKLRIKAKLPILLQRNHPVVERIIRNEIKNKSYQLLVYVKNFMQQKF